CSGFEPWFRPLATGLTAEGRAIISGASFETDFSHEASGIVTRVGDAVNKVSIGDRVVAFSSNTFSNFQRVQECLVQRLQDDEDSATMASLPLYYGAALYGLETLARLRPGESVLILPGLGLLGAAAIKVAQALGGHPSVAVRDSAEAEEVEVAFGVPRSQILVAYSPDRLMRCHEIDVVFSGSTTEPLLAEESWRNLPALSRFVSCSNSSASAAPSFASTAISRGASYLSVNITGLFKKPHILGGLLERIIELFRSGLIPAPLLNVQNIAEINHIGSPSSQSLSSTETVLVHEKGTGTVDVVQSRPRLELRSDATYLLVGCLGGLGRSLTTWMMKRGACHFAFLSRSGTDSEQARICVQELEARGANVQVFRGDAAVKEDVEMAVASISAHCPLRGVVNAAMVLRDGLFQNMSYDNWTTSIRPKVLGSKNLHEAIASLDLDFFLMTSSVSGILGTPTQANYAAANSYMDALACLRRRQGKHACAVVLPMILGVGVVAQDLDLEVSLKRKGMYGIDEEALLSAFEAAIFEQQHSQDSQSNFDHLVVGLEATKLYNARQEAEGDVDAFWTTDPRFSVLLDDMKQHSGDNQGDGEKGSILSQVKAASDSPAQAISLVRDHFISKLARVLLL
ncbi:unnamed protein product, partial [Fusarium langsethiae]